MTGEKTIYITKKGLNRIKKEYDFLKNFLIAKKKEEAPRLLESENINLEYVNFREDISMLEEKAEELKKSLQKAILIKKPAEADDTVRLGSTVEVEINGKQKSKLTIVGTLETNPSAGLISNESPVGKSLLGRKVNETVALYKTIYKIKNVKYSYV